MATVNATTAASIMTTASPLTVRAWHLILAQPDGRDKVLRLIQYVCKLLRGVLDARSGEYATVSTTATALESALASARQAWRLFKWTSIYTKHQNRFRSPSRAPCSSTAVTAPPSPLRSALLTVRYDFDHVLSLVADLGMFFYFVFDNLSFAAKTRLLPADVKKMAKRAAQWWTIGTVAAAVSSVLRAHAQRRRQQRALAASMELSKTAAEASRKAAVGNCTDGEHGAHSGDERHEGQVQGECQEQGDGDEKSIMELSSQREQRQTELKADALDAVRQQRAALVVAARHAADAVVAATNGYGLPVHTGVVGACGTLSSAIGLALAWPSLANS